MKENKEKETLEKFVENELNKKDRLVNLYIIIFFSIRSIKIKIKVGRNLRVGIYKSNRNFKTIKKKKMTTMIRRCNN